MTRRIVLPLALAVVLPLAACQQGASSEPAAEASPAAPAPTAAPFTEDAMLQFSGTEPFWGGHVEGTQLTYTWPENIDGVVIAVERSGEDGKLTLTGTFEGGPFAMTIAQGECSDGMSDRTYPLTATLTLGSEVRNGCAWSDAHPYSGPANP
jgi:uncharacterized membrane protein